ncbi:hypothetical protein ElyMa_006808600 [Elysia marginata]|uniref:Uncharacterized protein n=1 Tax=Elysia marginata TaxID=1093978 RepID=A0AAV4J3E5_9GAST|nr:hypothetical protein ElyMa_006808600 [Elysia marginata]
MKFKPQKFCCLSIRKVKKEEAVTFTVAEQQILRGNPGHLSVRSVRVETLLAMRHAKKFNRFHLCCLCKLLKVSWQDKVPDTEILEQSGMPSVFTLLQQTLLCWAGHVIRMSFERLPKRILYGELQSGARSHGGQMKIFKDTLKASMKDFNFDLTLWEALAPSRSAWCGPVIKGVKTYEQQCLQQRPNEQHKRPWPTVTQATAAPWTCLHYNRDLRARIGLISHLRAP